METSKQFLFTISMIYGVVALILWTLRFGFDIPYWVPVIFNGLQAFFMVLGMLED